MDEDDALDEVTVNDDGFPRTAELAESVRLEILGAVGGGGKEGCGKIECDDADGGDDVEVIGVLE